MRIARWRAVVPLAVFLLLSAVAWWLLLDTVVERTVESFGTDLVGARVELESADVRLREGAISLTGLQVTNPDVPMTNLFEAREIIARVRLTPLLEKKIFVDTVAIRGVRFGTERETSGAIAQPSATSRRVRQQIDQWADRVRIPTFSLEGLAGAVNVAALRPESLATTRAARLIVSAADSARRLWESQLQSLNPQPLIDSARSMVNALSNVSATPLGVVGLAQTVRSARSTLDAVNGLQDRVRNLEQNVRSGVAALQERVGGLSEARRQDLAYARSLLKIPSLDAPDISPALFGGLAMDRLRPVLRWVALAEQYMPPGLDPRRRPGTNLVRRPGTTMEFPRPGGYPKFALAFGEASFEIGGEGAGAGQYQALIRGLSTAPTLLGRPLEISASRTEAAQGPGDVQFAALLDHVTQNIRDSVHVRLAGVSLPVISLSSLGARMSLGRGLTELALLRAGDSVSGRWLWRAPDVSWERLAAGAGSGVPAHLEDFLWRTISAVEDAEVEVRFAGSVSGPRISVRSNLGSAIAASLRRQLQGEIDAAEQRVRAEVDRLVAEPVREAEARLGTLQSGVQTAIAQQRARVEQARAELEAGLRELGR